MMRFLTLASLLPYFVGASAVLLNDGSLLKADTYDFIVVGGATSDCVQTLGG
jgi:hypothetical protein